MDEQYDVIIVGAGIAGLVSGCYLAQRGLKTLIVEQHATVGGYCGSFRRKGFIFDIGVHYLGSCREGGALNKILRDFDLFDRLKLLQHDPCDRILTPDKEIYVRKNSNDTLQEFVANFPDEKEGLEDFFKFILTNDFLSLSCRIKNLSFSMLLDWFFKSYKLKSALSILLDNLGLPPSKSSALIAAVLFKEYIFDPGYYPLGGIQEFPSALAEKFESFGGRLLLKSMVTRILVRNNSVSGVLVGREMFIRAKYVISAVDATLTFQDLLDCPTEESARVNDLLISPSAYVLYLGIERNLNDCLVKHYVTHYFKTYDIDRCLSLDDINDDGVIDYALCSFPSLVDQSLAPPGKSVAKIIWGARYHKIDDWEKSREVLARNLMKILGEMVPGIETNIEVAVLATPMTFQRYTLNHQGAMFGWSSTITQTDQKVFPAETSVDNLYLAGHWVTGGCGQSGVSVVASCGRYVSRLILRKERKDN